MPRAYLRISDRSELYLQDTRVENLFIYEYLPSAPEGYVKVFLFGLMYAQNNMSMDTAKLSRVLHLQESEILQAWEYWAEKGLVKIEHSRDFTECNVEYLSQIDRMYGHRTEPQTQPEIPQKDVGDAADNPIDESAEQAVQRVIDMEISAIFRKYEELTGRMISTEDAWRINDTIKTYNLLPDVMSYAVDYCISEERASINQIIKTATRWAQNGCHNLADVKQFIDEHSKRNQYYNLVFKQMGWNRLPNPGDREIMDRWFDDMGCNIKEVLDACRASAGLREPSLKYVNRVIENRKLEAGGINTRVAAVANSVSETSERKESQEAPKTMVSKKVLREYYEFVRQESEKLQDARIDEVCGKVLALRDLFEFENRLNAEMMSTAVTPENREQRLLMRKQRKELEIEKKTLLREHGYSEDYLDRKYRCSVCKDTGITDDGRVCACSEARAREAYKWNQERMK